jgi:WD40 repeat protein
VSVWLTSTGKTFCQQGLASNDEVIVESTAAAAAPTGKSRAPKRNFASRVFGYDLFISFALGPPPRGTRSYASDLARRLREREFTVFFSEDEAAPGSQLDGTLLKALYRCGTLVVIANRRTLQEPRWVRREVEAFRSRHPDRPIIPISVGGALQDASLGEQARQWLAFDDKIWLDESQDAVAEGIASDEIVARLALVPTGRSSNVKWRWVVRSIVVALIILSGAATWFGIYARKESKIANANAREAQANAVRAEKQRQDAVAARRLADDNAKKATDNATEANRQRVIAEQQAVIAQRRARESRARELAAYATESLIKDPEKSVILGTYAINATFQFGATTVPVAEEVLHQAIWSSRLRLTVRGRAGFFDSVDWSPEGKRLVTGSTDGTASVWDAVSGKELLTLRGLGVVHSVAWSPDGKRLATGGADGTAKVWDAASGKELLILRGHHGSGEIIVDAPEGKRVITSDDDGTTKVLDAVSGKQLGIWKEPFAVFSVSWSPDGKRLATGGGDGTAKVWDAVAGKELLTLKSPDEPEVNGSGKELYVDFHEVYRVAWSPDGKRLATGSPNSVGIWDAEQGQRLMNRTEPGLVTGVAWSPDGRLLASGNSSGEAEVWNLVSGTTTTLQMQPFNEAPSVETGVAVAWSPDGRIATGNVDGPSAKVWDKWNPGEQKLMTLNGHTDVVDSVAWSPDGKRLATASFDKTVRVWDLASGAELPGLATSRTDPVLSLGWSPDGRRLATGSSNGTPRVWDPESGQELLKLNLGGGTKLAWSPNGKRLASYNESNTANVIDAWSGHVLLILRGQSKSLISLAWSPDGRRLATGSEDGTAMIWNLVSGKEMLILKAHHEPVVGLAWSPDGRRLATGSKDAKVWDTVSGRELVSLKNDDLAVGGVGWSPDGNRLVTWSGSIPYPWVGDRTAKVWDAASGRKLLVLEGHQGKVFDAAWSQTGSS